MKQDEELGNVNHHIVRLLANSVAEKGYCSIFYEEYQMTPHHSKKTGSFVHLFL